MRTHTTETLRRLVGHDMDGSKYKLSKQEIQTWTAVLPNIKEELFKLMSFFTGSIFDKQLIKRQIRQIQKESISLLDLADQYETLPVALRPLRKAVIQCLEEVLERVYTHCGNFADDEIFMASIHLKRDMVVLENQMDRLRANMTKRAVDQQLQTVIFTEFKAMIRLKRCTYFRMNYMVALFTSLNEVLENKTSNYVMDELKDHLYESNFNSDAFINYYQRSIKQEMQAKSEVPEKLRVLYRYEREFKMTPQKKSVKDYDARRRKIKDQLYEFITAEIRLIEKEERLRKQEDLPKVIPAVQTALVQYVLAQPAEVAAEKPEGYKIRTMLTVDALAYLVKLLIEGKVIEQGIRSELLAFICRIFQTPGTGLNGISATSMGVKYKQVNSSTAGIVKAALVRMIKIIDDEF